MAPSAQRLSVCEVCCAATASLGNDARTLINQSEAASCAQRRHISQSEAFVLPSLCPTVVALCPQKLQYIYEVITVNKDELCPHVGTGTCICRTATNIAVSVSRGRRK